MSAKMCGTCAGRGKVDDLRNVPRSGAWMYCGPNGERCPQMTCPNCYGTGWTGTPDGPMTVPDPDDPPASPTLTSDPGSA